MIRLLTFVLLLSCMLSWSQTAKEPVFISGEDVKYPPLARQARIQGIVEVRFGVDAAGVPHDIEVIAGHPMLAQGAIDNVQTWRFRPAQGLPTQLTSKFVFSLPDAHSDYSYDYERDTRTIRHGYALVEVQQPYIPMFVGGGGPPAADVCPREKVAVVAKTSPDDYLLLERHDYTVRLGANGEIQWKGRSAEGREEEHSITVSAQHARSLLDRFNSTQFWSLCERYSDGHGDSSHLSVRIGNREKSVFDHGLVAPRDIIAWEEQLDILANTHEWRHGDPQNEAITNIDDEYGKPGMSPLMQAIRYRDYEQIDKLLDEGADLSATDASGWTTLMYAERFGNDFLVQALLKRGADPDQVSLQNESALMLAARGGYLQLDLLDVGAKINLQNMKGQTVLMLLATKPQVVEIEEALYIGADPTVKDSQGLAALDYLRIANCGQNAAVEAVYDLRTNESASCNKIDPSDLAKLVADLTAPYHPLPKQRLPNMMREYM